MAKWKGLTNFTHGAIIVANIAQAQHVPCFDSKLQKVLLTMHKACYSLLMDGLLSLHICIHMHANTCVKPHKSYYKGMRWAKKANTNQEEI